jgi:hypothetical protein
MICSRRMEIGYVYFLVSLYFVFYSFEHDSDDMFTNMFLFALSF